MGQWGPKWAPSVRRRTTFVHCHYRSDSICILLCATAKYNNTQLTLKRLKPPTDISYSTRYPTIRPVHLLIFSWPASGRHCRVVLSLPCPLLGYLRRYRSCTSHAPHTRLTYRIRLLYPPQIRLFERCLAVRYDWPAGWLAGWLALGQRARRLCRRPLGLINSRNTH